MAGRPAAQTHYDVLGVEPAANVATIRAAYRRLAKAAHPDAGGSAGMFATLTTAHDVLRDPRRRAAYDAELAAAGPAAPAPWNGRQPTRYDAEVLPEERLPPLWVRARDYALAHPARTALGAALVGLASLAGILPMVVGNAVIAIGLWSVWDHLRRRPLGRR